MSFKADKILSLAANFEKTAQESSLAEDFSKTLFNYEHNAEAVKDFVEGLRHVAENFNRDAKSYEDPNNAKIYALLNKQAEVVARCIPEVAAIDAEIDKIAYQQPAESGVSSIQEEQGPETMRSRLAALAAKLDPKAKDRNRGTVCVPASDAKDKKDHFPINSESQARNALARVNQYSSVPEWYSGSLQSLVSLVARKVKSKYPSIEVSKDAKKPGKKAFLNSFDNLITKFAQNPPSVSDAGPVTWNTKEQTEEDAKTFMQPGGQHKVPGAPGTAYRPDVALAQRKLNDMQMRGTIQFGAALVPDGLMGPKTQAGLNAYKQYIGVPSLTNDLAIQALSKKQDQTEAANSYDPKLGF